jgi:hypothetical protein
MERDGVLRPFVRDGRLIAIPAKRAKRRRLLDLLAQDFEPGIRYPEAEVNRRLERWHPDVATLRRFLVDEGFLDRQGGGGHYWRAGGTFDCD